MSKPRCGECRRKFKNESALAMHNRTVHPDRKPAAPVKRSSRMGTGMTLLACSLVSFVVAALTTAGMLALVDGPKIHEAQAGLTKAVNYMTVRR